VWAEPTEVLHIADQVAQKYGPSGAVLVVTAAWTGGEAASIPVTGRLLALVDRESMRLRRGRGRPCSQ
jgi:hypothetical protein